MNCGHQRAYCSSPFLYMSMQPWLNDTDRRKPNNLQKPVPVPLCPPQISQGLTWVTMVRGQLSAWTMEESNECLFVVYLTTFFFSDSRLHGIKWRSDKQMASWKGCGRKQSCHNLRYYPSICLERLRKPWKISVRTAYLRAEIWTWDLLNTKHEC
jgi:hypothetical protein